MEIICLRQRLTQLNLWFPGGFQVQTGADYCDTPLERKKNDPLPLNKFLSTRLACAKKSQTLAKLNAILKDFEYILALEAKFLEVAVKQIYIFLFLDRVSRLLFTAFL